MTSEVIVGVILGTYALQQEVDVHTAFAEQLKHWRATRHLSQLDLALTAGVSQRHVSWLETGKSAPSRDMVVRLAEALDVPLRERNTLLGSAGFAAIYSERQVDAEQMRPIRDALEAMLAHHDPYPAFVLDRCWRVVMLNTSASRILTVFGNVDALWQRVDPSGARSLARLTFHPDGMRPYIENLGELAASFAYRIRSDLQSIGDPDQRAELADVLTLVSSETVGAEVAQPLLPILPLTLRLPSARISLMSVIATFGTPLDVTVDELRIESFYPADEPSKQLLLQMADHSE
ncbi:MAG: helix-turn-helix transcriptional regulator [Pseudomonadota bacterium]